MPLSSSKKLLKVHRKTSATMSFEAKEKKAKNCSEFKIIASFMRIDSLTIKLVDNCGRSC